MHSRRLTNGFSYLIEAVTACGLLLHVLIILKTWNLLPNSIPVHFDFAGKVDAWGSKTDLLLLFALSVLFYVGLTLLSRYPHKFNYPWKVDESNAEQQYRLARNFVRVIKLESVWLFAVISLQMTNVALGKADGLGYLFVPLVIVISSVTIISYLILASRSSVSNT